LVFKTLKHGYSTEITTDEKNEVLSLLQLLNPSDANYNLLKTEFEAITALDLFFFKILEVLFEMYKENNVCLDLMIGGKLVTAPKWDNFNKFQTEQHLKQIEPFVKD
jgi:hypothetical protein